MRFFSLLVRQMAAKSWIHFFAERSTFWRCLLPGSNHPNHQINWRSDHIRRRKFGIVFFAPDCRSVSKSRIHQPMADPHANPDDNALMYAWNCRRSWNCRRLWNWRRKCRRFWKVGMIATDIFFHLLKRKFILIIKVILEPFGTIWTLRHFRNVSNVYTGIKM